MPVKLIGKKVNYAGKTLWEIVGNLKNFGIGRLFTKDHFSRYPETSYYKILEVQPVQNPEKEVFERDVMVWVEHVFRGQKFSEPIMLYKQTYFTKFRLIPRSEEHKYLNATQSDRKSVVPPSQEWPPLFKALLRQDLDRQGNKNSPLPILKAKYQIHDGTVTVVDETAPMRQPLRTTYYTTDRSVTDLINEIERLTAEIKQKKATAPAAT